MRGSMKLLNNILIVLVLSMLSVMSSAYELSFRDTGWQLVSFPRLPENATVESVFGDAANDGSLTWVWTFDNESKKWSRWPQDSIGAISDISELKTGQGYWVYTDSGFNLAVESGGITPGGQTLYPGWNLIGATGDSDMPYEQALAGVPFLELWSYDLNSSGFKVVRKSGGSGVVIEEQFLQVETGNGYWAYVTEQTSLVPSLGTFLPADVDIEPLLNHSKYGQKTFWDNVSPGDIDWNGDGYFDFPNTQNTVAFGDFLNRQRMSITNTGNGVLSWTATIEPAVKWLLFEAFDEDGNPVLTDNVFGNVSDINGELVMVANRVGMAPSDNYSTQIVLRSNGDVPEKRIDVILEVADIVGDYEVTVRLDSVNAKDADLHNPKYFISFARDGAGVKAFMDEERSLLIPETTYLSGTYVGNPENNFQLLGQLNLPEGHEHNPYSSDVRREFTLIGQRSDGRDGLSPLDLKGEYSENIYGLFEDPVLLKGEFVATRISSKPRKQDNRISDDVNGDIVSSHENGGVSEFTTSITDPISITDIQALVDIEHVDPESLKIELVGPEHKVENGAGIEIRRTYVILHEYQNRSLSSLNFDEYDTTVESLAVYEGQLAAGDWMLRITNTSESIGRLLGWELDIKGANVYSINGTTESGVRLQLTGCGVSITTTSDAVTGDFSFDGLIPCNYKITVVQLGYEVSFTEVNIVGCYSNDTEACSLESDYQVELTAVQLLELNPQVATVPGEMKVVTSPVNAFLPSKPENILSVRSIDVTDYPSLDSSLISRDWALYKHVNAWTRAPQDGYLMDSVNLIDYEKLKSLSPDKSSYEVKSDQNLDSYSLQPAMFYFDLTVDTTVLSNQVMFETGGSGVGLVIFQNATDLMVSIGTGNDIDLTVNDVFKDNTRYGLVVELQGSNTITLFLARLDRNGAPLESFKPIAMDTWAGNFDWSGGDNAGWGLVNSGVQTQVLGSYVPFSGTWHLGQFFSQESVSLLESNGFDGSDVDMNYFSYSEDHSQWYRSSNISLEYTDDTLDPRGGNSAIKATHAGNGQRGIIFDSSKHGQGAFNVAQGELVTLSVFLKPGSTSQFRFRFADGSSYKGAYLVDIITAVDSGTANVRSTPLANGWYRVEATYEATSDFQDFHCDAWFVFNNTYNINSEGYIYVYGPQCEKHSATNDMGMTAYIPTGENHGSRFDSSILVASKSGSTASTWNNSFPGRSDFAGSYYINLDSQVTNNLTSQQETLSYKTGDIILQYMPTNNVHFGAISTYAGAGTTSLNAMDTATFDINRPPLVNTQGIEDSDSFTAEIDPATETNASNMINENPVNPGQYSFLPSGFDAPVGKTSNHFRVYVSTGQLIHGLSAYGGGFRLDTGIQSAQKDDNKETD